MCHCWCWLSFDFQRKRENVLQHVGEVNGEKTKQATPPDQLKAIKHKVEGANSGSPAL